MLNNIFLLIALTFIPALGLRLSIPYGILVLNMNPYLVIPIVLVTNALLGLLTYFIVERIVAFVVKLGWFGRIYEKHLEKNHKKAKHYAKSYGVIGLSLFIGIPLPGTGTWAGAIAAHALDIDFKKFMIANIIGVLIAGTLVSLVSLGVLSIPVFIKL